MESSASAKAMLWLKIVDCWSSNPMAWIAGHTAEECGSKSRSQDSESEHYRPQKEASKAFKGAVTA